MRKNMLFFLGVFLLYILFSFFTAQAAELLEPGQEVSEQTPEENEEQSGKDKDEDSMVPIEPGEENPASQPGEDSFGLSLSSAAVSNNSGGSPWGGILFFIAAISLGIGLAIARNKK